MSMLLIKLYQSLYIIFIDCTSAVCLEIFALVSFFAYIGQAVNKLKFLLYLNMTQLCLDKIEIKPKSLNVWKLRQN